MPARPLITVISSEDSMSLKLVDSQMVCECSNFMLCGLDCDGNGDGGDW